MSKCTGVRDCDCVLTSDLTCLVPALPRTNETNSDKTQIDLEHCRHTESQQQQFVHSYSIHVYIYSETQIMSTFGFIITASVYQLVICVFVCACFCWRVDVTVSETRCRFCIIAICFSFCNVRTQSHYMILEQMHTRRRLDSCTGTAINCHLKPFDPLIARNLVCSQSFCRLLCLLRLGTMN